MQVHNKAEQVNSNLSGLHAIMIECMIADKNKLFMIRNAELFFITQACYCKWLAMEFYQTFLQITITKVTLFHQLKMQYRTCEVEFYHVDECLWVFSIEVYPIFDHSVVK